MRKTLWVLASASAAIFGFGIDPVLAQANRTFVSGQGSDSNPCSLSAPCRSFQQAHNQTNPGGEITILDPAGYGSVQINKAIIIVNDGVGEAGITVAGNTSAIVIGAGASDVVNLRGLTLVGNASSIDGIDLNTAGTVNIQNCVIRGFHSFGFQAGGGLGTVSINVSDTIFSNNQIGVEIQQTGSGTTNVVFERVQAIGNSLAIEANGGFSTTGGTLNVIARDSVASGNQTGFEVASFTGGAITTFSIVNSLAVGNGFGLSSVGVNATMLVSRSTVSGNSTDGYQIASGGVMLSAGDNSITDTSNLGTLGSFIPK